MSREILLRARHHGHDSEVIVRHSARTLCVASASSRRRRRCRRLCRPCPLRPLCPLCPLCRLYGRRRHRGRRCRCLFPSFFAVVVGIGVADTALFVVIDTGLDAGLVFVILSAVPLKLSPMTPRRGSRVVVVAIVIVVVVVVVIVVDIVDSLSSSIP